MLGRLLAIINNFCGLVIIEIELGYLELIIAWLFKIIIETLWNNCRMENINYSNQCCNIQGLL